MMEVRGSKCTLAARLALVMHRCTGSQHRLIKFTARRGDARPDQDLGYLPEDGYDLTRGADLRRKGKEGDAEKMVRCARREDEEGDSVCRFTVIQVWPEKEAPRS